MKMPTNYKIEHLKKKLHDDQSLEFNYVVQLYGSKSRAQSVWASLVIQGLMDEKGKSLPVGD